MKKNINPARKEEEGATASIPLPTNHIHRTQSELQLVQDELLADYQDGQMYERILTGILRRCDKMGTYHPKTSSSLESIMITKMQDYRSLSERRTSNDDDDWGVGDDQSEHIRGFMESTKASSGASSPERGLTRHKVSFTSSSSSMLETATRRNSSMPSLSSLTSHMDDSPEATHDIDSGIFDLEL